LKTKTNFTVGEIHLHAQIFFGMKRQSFEKKNFLA